MSKNKDYLQKAYAFPELVDNDQNEVSQFLPPCKFQNGESVRLDFGLGWKLPCRVLATKCTAKHVFYDLEVWLYGTKEDPEYTRFYHVESRFVTERIDAEEMPSVGTDNLELTYAAALDIVNAVCEEKLPGELYKKWRKHMYDGQND